MGDLGGICEIACEAISWFCDMAKQDLPFFQAVRKAVLIDLSADGREARDA